MCPRGVLASWDGCWPGSTHTQSLVPLEGTELGLPSLPWNCLLLAQQPCSSHPPPLPASAGPASLRKPRGSCVSQGRDLVTLGIYRLRPFGQFLPQPSPHFCIWLNVFSVLEQEKTWQKPGVCVARLPLLGWWAARRPGEFAALAPLYCCEPCGHVTAGARK